MSDPDDWTARLAAGPFDGARLSLDMGQDALPRAIVVAFAVGPSPSRLVWHSYVLDGSRDVFRYLGEGTLATDAEAAVGLDPGQPDATDGALARRFYELLFDRDPNLRAMFSREMKHQAATLQTAMNTVLHHRDDPEWLVTTLGALGARHAALGVADWMYPVFVECMLSAMADTAGGSWTAEMESEWRGTLEDITSLMIAGASPDSATT